MTDFYADAENVVKLAPQEQHRIRSKAALKNIVHLDDHPHDLLEMIFSREELEWLRENLRT